MWDDHTDDDEIAEMPSIRKEDDSALHVFLAWEKLRLVYNAALCVVVLIRVLIGDELGLASLIPAAISANVCYCAGSIAEGYICWIWKLDRPVVRSFVFGVGLILAIAIAFHVRAVDMVPILN